MYSEESIIKLTKSLFTVCGVLDDFGASMSEKKKSITLEQRTFNDLLNRIRINFEGSKHLIEPYAQEPALFLPISQVMRSLMVDSLTVFYLVAFFVLERDNKKSFRNEVAVLDRDYVRTALEQAEVEKLISVFDANYPVVTEEEHEQKIMALREFFRNVFTDDENSNGTRDNSALRSSSNKEMFFGRDSDIRRPLNEKFKYEKIMEFGFGAYIPTYDLYKYFSLQYHYCSVSNLPIRDDQDHNFMYIVQAVNYSVIACLHCVELVDETSFSIIEHLNECRDSLAELINE